MTAVAGLLLAGGLTYACSLLLGTVLLRMLGVKVYRTEERFLGFILGSAALSTFSFLLTAAGLAYPATFLALAAMLIVIGLWRGAYRSSAEEPAPLPGLWRWGFLAVYLVFAAVYLIAALAPETGPDAMAYHVAFPARYLRLHHFPADTRNLLASLSEGVEMLFVFAYPLARESAGAMVHLLFLLVLPWGMLSYGRRIGFPAAGAAAGLLFFVTPVVGRLGTTGYIDVAVACYAFAVFYLLEIWRTARAGALLVAVGLVSGFCFDAKYTAGAAVPFAIAYTAFYLWRERKSPWRAVLVIGLCALAMMSPYLIKNLIVTGNPLAPFASRFFPNRLLSPVLEARYSYVMRHWEGVTWKEVPRELLVSGGRLQGIIGPVFALAPLALLALRFPAGRQLLVAFLFFAATYPASIATRFFVPALPFLALALALAIVRWPPTLAALVLLHAGLSWPTMVARYTDPTCWRLRNVHWRIALRRVPETDYLRGTSRDYDVGRMVAAHVPAGEPVFTFQGLQQLYQTREILMDWESIFCDRLGAAMNTPLWTSMVQQFQFPERRVRRLRVFQGASKELEDWGITELRIWSRGRELPRSAAWRLTASHNRQDVGRAFDNNPVTRWSSAAPAAPGMWIQVDLGADTPIDRVTVETTDRERGVVRLSLDNASQWEPVANGPEESLVPAAGRIRRAATELLKREQVNWLLIRPSDPLAGDLDSSPGSWGVTLTVGAQDFRLYHIN